MPKQRQTCTRCSQRRQKCDRKAPCTRCVQNNEGHLCTTKWVNGYNPSVHRKYPTKPSPSVSWQSAASSSTTTSSLNTSPPDLEPTNGPSFRDQDSPSLERTSTTAEVQAQEPAWSSKFRDITIGTLLTEKDAPSQRGLFDRSFKEVQSRAKTCSHNASYLSPAARTVEIQHIQSLLPSKTQVVQIVEYYEQYMLYWGGGLYHAPTFRRKLLDAYGLSQELNLQNQDWRWTGLLFSILSSGIIGSSETVSLSWGFTIDDKVRLAREWGSAAVSALNLGNFTSQYHIDSVQAIYIMHSYEHLVGSTNQWIALRSVAVIIAKGLGLHKLGPHPDDDRILELNPEQKQAFIEREIGRRTWFNLTCQEWLCATAQTTHIVSIQRRHFTTSQPHHLDEETMTPVDEATPTMTIVGTYFFDYATLLLEFHNSMADAPENEDDQTRYARVLKFDGEMRAICAEKMPKCLSPRTPPNPNWPKWVGWARKLHQASVNHKLIMLHQSFLSKSFKDVRYTYSRWACATAAKNIINLYGTREPDEPQWWVEQAFIVTAGICLVLDLFHRTENDREAQEYQACVQRSISFLQQCFTSTVAVHGVRLLVSLLQEHTKILEGSRSNANQLVGSAKACPGVPATITDINVPDAARAPSTHTLPLDPEVPLSLDEAAQFNFDIDALGFEDLMDYLPAEGGLDNNVFLDSMCTLSGVQFNY